MHFWAISSLRLLRIVLLWTFLYLFSRECAYTFLLGTYIEVELLGNRKCTLNASTYCQVIFSSAYKEAFKRIDTPSASIVIKDMQVRTTVYIPLHAIPLYTYQKGWNGKDRKYQMLVRWNSQNAHTFFFIPTHNKKCIYIPTKLHYPPICHWSKRFM